MQRRLRQLKSEEASASDREPAKKPAASADGTLASLGDGEIEAIVRSAYLRTLTRLPEPGEIERARSYFAEVPPREATRDLMWALLNTKEFQLNH